MSEMSELINEAKRGKERLFVRYAGGPGVCANVLVTAVTDRIQQMIETAEGAEEHEIDKPFTKAVALYTYRASKTLQERADRLMELAQRAAKAAKSDVDFSIGVRNVSTHLLQESEPARRIAFDLLEFRDDFAFILRGVLGDAGPQDKDSEDADENEDASSEYPTEGDEAQD